MSAEDHHDDARTDDDDQQTRYAALELGDGETLVYDREAPAAWIRSDAAVDARGAV